MVRAAALLVSRNGVKDALETMRRELNKTEARQGRTLGRMRWVLSISLLLAVLALGLIYLAFA